MHDGEFVELTELLPISGSSFTDSMHNTFLSATDFMHGKFLSVTDFMHFLRATRIQLSSLTTRAGGGMLVLVVAVAGVGALDFGVGVGVLAPVVGVAETILDVGVGAGVLAPVMGVAEVGAVRIWISSSPHRSNPVSSITLDTDSVGTSSVVASATVFGHAFAS